MPIDFGLSHHANPHANSTRRCLSVLITFEASLLFKRFEQLSEYEHFAKIWDHVAVSTESVFSHKTSIQFWIINLGQMYLFIFQVVPILIT